MRSGAGLGMELHSGNLQAGVLESGERLVVEVDVCRLSPRCLDAIYVHAEAMVLTRDLNATRLEVSDRVVRTPVPEAELIGLRTQCTSEQLVAQTNTDDRLGTDHLLHLVDHVIQRTGVTGTVG